MHIAFTLDVYGYVNEQMQRGTANRTQEHLKPLLPQNDQKKAVKGQLKGQMEKMTTKTPANVMFTGVLYLAEKPGFELYYSMLIYWGT